MDTKDAWLLFAGALLGFIGSLLATFTAPSIGSTFAKLRSGFIERNKASALANYALVRDLKSGKRDKYLYAITHWGMISLMTLSCIFAGGAGVATRRIMHQAPELEHTQQAVWLLLLVFPILVLLLLARSTLRLLLTLDRVENFDDYRAKLLKRWPDLVLPE